MFLWFELSYLSSTVLIMCGSVYASFTCMVLLLFIPGWSLSMNKYPILRNCKLTWDFPIMFSSHMQLLERNHYMKKIKLHSYFILQKSINNPDWPMNDQHGSYNLSSIIRFSGDSGIPPLCFLGMSVESWQKLISLRPLIRRYDPIPMDQLLAITTCTAFTLCSATQIWKIFTRIIPLPTSMACLSSSWQRWWACRSPDLIHQ